ncbi:hypothetical protein [Arthrobacter sp. HY1533]|uniref:hypothetical protein n=1 Tax=Arthrobacter sp. HY1533 TaxID=2970919 RepID=UPI0022B9D6FB|nr:hypothetical protein [Arthrobacter sp. HY1533]
MDWQTITDIVDWGSLAAMFAILAALGAGLMWIFKVFLPLVRKWSRRWDVLFGIPADPATGQEHVPGISERLDSQDAVLTAQNVTLARMELAVNAAVQQVQNSHVTNMRDDLDNVTKSVEGLHTKLDDQLKAAAAQPQTQININPTETTT